MSKKSERDDRSMGEVRRGLHEAAMGVSGQGEKSFSQDPENDSNNDMWRIFNKSSTEASVNFHEQHNPV